MLQLDFQQILSQVICFIILWMVLKRLAWGPLLYIIDQRREKIELDLKQAESAKADMQTLQKDLEKRLVHIDEEAREKIQQAVLEGRRIASQIQDDARSQAHELLARSKETIELELAKAKVSLRDQLTDMTVEAVERVMRQKLDRAADAAMIDEILDDLEHKGARP